MTRHAGPTAIVGDRSDRVRQGSRRTPRACSRCQAIVAALDDAGIAAARGRRPRARTRWRRTEEVESPATSASATSPSSRRSATAAAPAAASSGQAAMAVATGQCEVAVAWRARKRGRPRSRPWAQRGEPARRAASSGRRRSACCARSTRSPCSPAATCTSTARTRDHLANVALGVPQAREPQPRGDDGRQAADPRATTWTRRWISEPLCLFDNCLETDGALAVVITSAERARDLPQPPGVRPRVRAVDPAAAPDDDQLLQRRPAARARRGRAPELLWAQADVGPADVDVAQLYDAFSPLIPLSLEGYGFCARGEGGAVHRRRRPRVADGRLPTNTSGGGMSEAYVHGFNLVARRRAPAPRHVDQPGRRRGRLARDERRGRAHRRAAPAGMTMPR